MWLCSSAAELGCWCCIEENQSRKVKLQYYASTEELVQVAASGVKSLAHRAMGARQSSGAVHRKSLTPVTAGSRSKADPSQGLTTTASPPMQSNLQHSKSIWPAREFVFLLYIYKISTLCQLFWSTRLIKQLEYYCASPFQFMIRRKSWWSRGRCVFVCCRLRGLTLYKAWGWQTY